MKLKSLGSLILLLFSFSSYAELVLKDLQGQAIPISSLKGKWVLINYWASWCHPCLSEIPELNRFYLSHKQTKDVEVFAVNYEDLPVAEQEQLIDKLGIKYPSLLAKSAKELHLGDITGVPVTFVFNPKGELATALYGPQSVRSLNRVLAANY